MKAKALIFDLDGVVTDTARFHFLAWKSLADSLGFHFDEQDNERLKGVSRIRSFEIILEINGALDRFTEAEKEALCAKKNEIYKDLVSAMTPEDILPGIPEILARAKAQGVPVALASVSKNAPAVLRALGLQDAFDYVADAAKVKNSKPDPEIFEVCAEALGVPCGDCVGIEDAQAGIEAIHAAGMKSVGIRVAVTSIAPDIALGSTAELADLDL